MLQEIIQSRDIQLRSLEMQCTDLKERLSTSEALVRKKEEVILNNERATEKKVNRLSNFWNERYLIFSFKKQIFSFSSLSIAKFLPIIRYYFKSSYFAWDTYIFYNSKHKYFKKCSLFYQKVFLVVLTYSVPPAGRPWAIWVFCH